MLLMALGLVEMTNGELPATVTNQTSYPQDTQKVSTNQDGDNSMQNSPLTTLWTFISNQFDNFVAGQCHSSYSMQPLYYHIGCTFFFLAFLAPSYRSYNAALYQRSMFVFGCILFIMWSYLTECAHVLMWTALFIFVNLIHMAIILIFQMKPVKFEKEIESVYVALFKPLRVSRRRFKKVLNCLKTIRKLKPQEIYVQEKITKVDSLSLVLTGKFVVSQSSKCLHIVFPHQFLDSPEYFGVSTDDFFTVSITAIDESKVLIWHRDKLKLSIITDEFLQVVFDHILGRDIVYKLMQVSETMASNNGFISSSNGYNDEGDINKPMLIIKKPVDNQGNGLTALINKQLQAENPEHENVPLLITSHQKQNAAASTTINISKNNNSDMPVIPLSSNTPAYVMRSRLNQYKVTGYQNSMIVNMDENGTTISTKKTLATNNKKKKSADI